MGRIENDGIRRIGNNIYPKIEPKPTPKVEIQKSDNSSATRKGEVRFQEQQQRDRLES